ncbi:hypothetical protein L0Y59_01320 [Candidatus Uhrbacteria bacterium]|nr:hypothetical protein [Candidatus Uhrbacteria bacterium]
MKKKNTGIRSFADSVVRQMLFLGIGFILWAVLFIIWPESFVYLVSAFFVFFGGQSIMYALRIRRANREMRQWLDDIAKKLG